MVPSICSAFGNCYSSDSWSQTLVEVMKIMVTSFKRSHACTATLSAPNPATGHCWPTPLLETPGHSRASLGQSLVGSLLLSPGSWCTPGSVCALQESVSPVLGKFWQLYGGVNGDLLQESLCHTQVYWTQSSCPCGSPLLTCPSAGDTQTQFLLSLCGVSGSWVCTKFVWALWAFLVGMGFDSKHNFPVLPSCWGFSFVVGHGVSPHSCLSTAQLSLHLVPSLHGK